MPAVSVPLGAAAIGAGGSILGGILGSNAAKKNAQAMREALAYQKQRDAQTRADLAPYRDFGGQQLNAFTGWLNDPTKNPSAYLDPGYEFRRDQGNIGIENNAATSGLLQSGDTLRGLTKYGQDASSQEYNNAFNRYLGEGNFRQSNAAMGENATLAGAVVGQQGTNNFSNTSANLNAGGSDAVWGNVASQVGNQAGNAFARLYPQGNPASTNAVGGSNTINAGRLRTGSPQQYMTDPYYMNMR